MRIIRVSAMSGMITLLAVAPILNAQKVSVERTLLKKQEDEYKAAEKYDLARAAAEKVVTLTEKEAGPDHPETATSLEDLALILFEMGEFTQAEPLLVRILKIREKALGPEHPDVARSLGYLAVALADKGRFPEAEGLLLRSIPILGKSLGPDNLDLADQLGYLVNVLVAQAQYARAEQVNLRALAIREKVQGKDSIQVAGELNRRAAIVMNLGRPSESEIFFKQALAIRQKVQGPEHRHMAEPLQNLANLYFEQGKYAQAEPLYRQALAITEKAYGLDHPNVAMRLNNLATVYNVQKDYAQAEPLYLRALAIVEKAFGKDHKDVGSVLHNLGFFYFDQGQYRKAEPMFLRSLAITEKTYGPEHPEVANTLSLLGDLCITERRYSEAEPHLSRALAIREKILGPDHPDVAISLSSLANLKKNQGQFTEAEALYARALAVRERSTGPDHPLLGRVLVDIADFHVFRGNPEAALMFMRRAGAIYRRRVVNSSVGDTPAQVAARFSNGFVKLLTLLAENPAKEAPGLIVDESFQVAQLQRATAAGTAVAKMAARFARGDDPVATLTRRKQDALDQRGKLQTRLIRASSQPPDKRNLAEEQKQREEVLRLGHELEAADTELNARFPEYQVLTRPDPLAVGEVQPLLHPDEAMLTYSVGRDGAWMWVVRAKSAEFIPLKITEKTLSEDIKKLRKQMEIGASGQLRQVDVATLHSLYQKVFAPAVPHLAGIKHLMLVLSGPLQSLPFATLVASPPKEIKTNNDYRNVDWLMKRYAFSVLPSVGSIQAFRQFTKAGTAQEPFIGFGDPLLKEDPGATQPRGAGLRLAGLFRKSGTSPETGQTLEVADVEIIRQQVRLPESGDEIKAMARIAKAGPDSIWLQEKATEKNVKTLDLSNYRMIAFATHGVMADEFGYGMEPGLLLTPPAQGTLEDDGYLAAGEIARLKLNADWVLLSACNTAAADGSPGAEGMSGLAKAFFYAGSRSLLVSHWPVASEATVALTTRMLREYEAKPGRGKAEAHRQAMLALMNMPKHPEYAHPLFWSPFVVVGEGGPAGAKAGSLGTSAPTRKVTRFN